MSDPRELLGEDRWEDLLDTAATAIADRFDAERYSHRDGIERCEYGCALTLAYQGSEDLAELMLRAVLPGLLAQAWEQGHRASERDWEMVYNLSTPDEDRQPWTNPYRKEAENNE